MIGDNVDSQGWAGAWELKILAVSPFQEGLKKNIDMLNRLDGEMKTIETSIEALVALDEAFKGEGGSAIRSFYNEVHLPFIRLFHMMQSDFLNVLERMVAALNQLEPNPSGFIRESFLEGEVEQGLTEIARITASLTDEANQIMNQVADIVALPNLDDSGVQDGVYNAKRKRDNTIKELHQFDSEQTAALTAIQDHMEVMERWITDTSGLFTDNRTDIQFDTGQWAQLLAKNILQTDPSYQANFTAGAITNPDLKEELEQHMETIVEAQNAVKQPTMEEETFNVSKAALKGGVGLASAYQAQPTLNQGLQAQSQPMSNPAGKSKNFIPPQAGKLVKGAADFLILDDINTILDKDASLLDKGLAVVSVTPVGKGIKAARLGFKLIKKAFGGKVKKVEKVKDSTKMGIVNEEMPQVRKNAIKGRKFEEQEFAKFKNKTVDAVEQITIKTNTTPSVRVRVDAIGFDKKTGKIVINEYKSSQTASLTKNQKIGFPDIEEVGGTVVGKGKGKFTGGVTIPSGTKVEIIRPDKQ